MYNTGILHSTEIMEAMGIHEVPKADQEDSNIPYSHGWDVSPLAQSNEWCYDTHGVYTGGTYLPRIHCSTSAYPNCDLDWKPSARWMPSPRYCDAPFPHIKDNKFPDRITLLRSCPRSSQDVGAEWTFYPNLGFPYTYHKGKRCTFDGIHWSNQGSSDVQKLQTCIGRKKKVCDPRNGIPEAKPGDKPFRTPEYSPSFHKFGSTRPVVNFRESYKVKADTFIPLQKLPKKPSVPYRVKVQIQGLEEEKREVQDLCVWKPSDRSLIFEVPAAGLRAKPE